MSAAESKAAVLKGLLSVMILESMINNEHRRFTPVKLIDELDGDYKIEPYYDPLDHIVLLENKAPVEKLATLTERCQAF